MASTMKDGTTPRPWLCDHLSTIWPAKDGPKPIPGRYVAQVYNEADARLICDAANSALALTRAVTSLVRAHYDRDERRFHEVSDELAKCFDQTGRADLASFVRAQTGDEPSWVPMDAAPTSSAPTAEPPVKSAEGLLKDADYTMASFRILLLAKKIARLLLRHAEGGEYSDSYDVYAEARELLAEDDSASQPEGKPE